MHRYAPYGFVIVLAIALLFLWTRKCSPEKIAFQPSRRWVEPYKGSVRNDDSIFISIASYRDKDCIRSVKDAIAKASNPEKIFFGVVQQNRYSCEDCLPDTPNVRHMSLHYSEARGPSYARYLCSTLYRGETFFLQIDSHTRFEKGWDNLLVDMWRSIGDPNAVISHYPQPFDSKTNKPMGGDNVPRNCNPHWNDAGLMNMGGYSLAPTETPKLVYWTGAGMMFLPGQALLDVPFDDTLDHLFHGEELLYSARLFTHGYNVYAPNKNIVYHWYTREKESKFWDDLGHIGHAEQRQKSEGTVKSILGLDGKSYSGPFGLGTKRPLSELWKNTNIDVKNKTANQDC